MTARVPAICAHLLVFGAVGPVFAASEPAGAPIEPNPFTDQPTVAERAASGVSDAAPPRVSLGWAVTQLIPSIGVSVARETAQFHMSWQLTPLLYSWGVQPGLEPWRVLIAEPSVRQSGSIELFLSPEYFGVGRDWGDKWGLRAGVRSYFPLYARGEYLSLSIGAGMAHYAGQTTPSYELGLHVLFGTLGLVAIVNPTLLGGEGIGLVRWRYY